MISTNGLLFSWWYEMFESVFIYRKWKKSPKTRKLDCLGFILAKKTIFFSRIACKINFNWQCWRLTVLFICTAMPFICCQRTGLFRWFLVVTTSTFPSGKYFCRSSYPLVFPEFQFLSFYWSFSLLGFRVSSLGLQYYPTLRYTTNYLKPWSRDGTDTQRRCIWMTGRWLDHLKLLVLDKMH